MMLDARDQLTLATLRASTAKDAEIERLRAALKELADAAEIDLKCNQDYDGKHAPGGWWTLRTENAIRAARAFEQTLREGEG